VLTLGNGHVRNWHLWQLGGTHPAGAASRPGTMIAAVKPAAADRECRVPLGLHDRTGSRKEVSAEEHQPKVPNG